MQIKNLTIRLKKDGRSIIDNLTFSINNGDRLALIGEEGNGKSTLIKALTNINDVLTYADISGEISRDESIAIMPQIATADVLCKSLSDLIYDNDGLTVDIGEFYKLINAFNVDVNDLERKLETYSGGERMKILISLAIAKGPSLLILDEPTNDIDFESMEVLERVLKDFNGKIIFASHDTYFIEKLANKIIHFELLQNKTKSRINISGNDYDTYIKLRAEQISTQMQRAKNDKARMDEKEARWRHVHDSVEHDLRKEKNDRLGRYLKKTMHEVKAHKKLIEWEKEKMTKKPEYEEQIFVNYNKEKLIENGKCVLNLHLKVLRASDEILAKDINLESYGNNKIAIVGKNGAGKTTLLNIIKDNISKDLRVSYMPQNYEEELNVHKNAIEYLRNDFTKDEETKIRTYLASLKFTKDEVTKNISELSGGQKAKLFFARMQLMEPDILVLDEPTRNISPLSLPSISNEMKTFGGAIFFVSHDRYFINHVADEIYELDESGLIKRSQI